MVEDLAGLPGKIERARLSAKLSLAAAILVAVIEIVAILAGPVKGWAGLDIFNISVLPFGLAFLFAVAAAVRANFLSKALIEEEEKLLLEKRKESHSSIMDISEDVRFTAGRTLSNYEIYAPWALAFLGFVITTAVLVLFWRAGVSRVVPPAPANALQTAFTASVIMLAGLFCGVFLVGQSQVKEFRWLRPVGAWLIAGFCIMGLAALTALLYRSGKTGWDVPLTKILCLILAALGIEFLCNFIMEFYRPRTQLEERPVYESRLLALFTEPGGVVRNIADTLDYQFGFKVSKTWIYEIVQRSLLPGILIWLFALWIFTGIVDVMPGEIGLRERFGAPVGLDKPLEAGVHFKLPWPFEKIVRVPVERVEEILVGVDLTRPENKGKAPKVILWTTDHFKEDCFLVANEGIKGSKDADVANAVSILVANIPVDYQVRRKDAADYAFKFVDVPAILRNIGEREATSYFASADFIKTMSYGREKVARDLADRIQKSADAIGLGVDIVSVNLHDVHPSVDDVAPAFQDVLCALEERETAILGAAAYKIRVGEDAKIDSLNIAVAAAAYKYSHVKIAAAEAERFKRQLSAYNAMPSMFKLRSYLDFLESDCKDVRKYLVPATMPYQIYEINMEEKARLDLLDANLGELAK